ncbi:MAG: hypothetical protein Q9219_005614 [cf. Caloplaca sp. 3 TL-2023]
MSWLWRGFQSAVFYYLSCAPCNQLAYRRRRRKGAARSKREKATEEGLYRHPSPFSTNIYWREEMALGPGPPQKKRDRDHRERQQQQQRSTGRGAVADKSSGRDLMTGSSAETGTSSADTMVASSSLQCVVELEHERRRRRSGDDDNWNRTRYQREDEFLWGSTGNDDSAASAEDLSETSYRLVARNPSVNDLHPPVVSTRPAHRSETRWMLQPPPSAKVMEGKERATRSRSGSNGSSRRGETGLVRQIGERMVGEKKRRKGQSVHPAAVAPNPTVFTSGGGGSGSPAPSGQPHERDPPAPSPFSTIPNPHSDSHRHLHLLQPPSSSTLNVRANIFPPPPPPSTTSSSLPLHPDPDLDLNLENKMDPETETEVEIPVVGMTWPPSTPPSMRKGRGKVVGREKANKERDKGERWSMDI